MYVHEELVNCLGGLSLPRKSVVRLTDRPDMTLDIYRGRKTTMQPTNKKPKGMCNMEDSDQPIHPKSLIILFSHIPTMNSGKSV